MLYTRYANTRKKEIGKFIKIRDLYGTKVVCWTEWGYIAQYYNK